LAGNSLHLIQEVLELLVIGLTKGLHTQGEDVIFVLPKSNPKMKADFVKLISANIKKISIDSPLKGYMDSNSYQEVISIKKEKKENQEFMEEIFSKKFKDMQKKQGL